MAILATEKVLTLDWWKPASHLRVGDYVFDKDGKIVKVTLVQEYRSESCYEVVFSDYLTANGDEHLKLPTENLKYRNRAYSYKGVHKFRRPLKPLSVKQIVDIPLRDKRNRLALSVPTAKPLELPHKDYPVPPFLFGFWFFASKSTKKLLAGKGYGEYVVEKFKEYGYKVELYQKTSKGEPYFTVAPSIESQFAPNIPTQLTQNYLLGSPEQRIELLSGILCAKGRQYSPSRNTFRITSTHFGTVRLIQGLAESLGCRTKLSHDDYLNNYTISFKSTHQLVPNQISSPVKVHQSRRYITQVNPLPAQMCVHIETSAPDNTILVGEGFISVC